MANNEQIPDLPIGLAAFADAFIDMLIQIDFKLQMVLELLEEKTLVSSADIEAKVRSTSATPLHLVEENINAARKHFQERYETRFQMLLLKNSKPAGPKQ